MKTRKQFLKEAFTLGLPVAGQMLLSSLVSTFDNIMIGQLGEVNISAVSVAGTFSWLATVFIYGSVKGAAIIGAQDYGRNDKENIKKLLSFVITLGFFVSLLFFLIVKLNAENIIRIYSTFEDLVEPGAAYLQIVKYSYFLVAISYAGISMMQSMRSVQIGMFSSIASCIGNVVFNYILINGKFGFPALGIEGAAIATCLARLLECITVLYYVLRIDKKLEFKLKDFDPRIGSNSLRQLVRISLPILLTEVLDNLTSSAQTMITGRLSEYYLSANSITHACWNLPSVFCFGAGTAAAIMIGNSLGRRDYEQARQDAKRLVILSFFIGAFCSVSVRILLPIVSSFYSVSQETVDLAYKMGNMATINVWFIAFDNVIANGILKATGNTKKTLYVNLLGKWFIALPLGYIGAFYLNLSPEYIYFLLRSGSIIVAIWGFAVLIKGEWMATIE